MCKARKTKAGKIYINTKDPNIYSKHHKLLCYPKLAKPSRKNRLFLQENMFLACRVFFIFFSRPKGPKIHSKYFNHKISPNTLHF